MNVFTELRQIVKQSQFLAELRQTVKQSESKPMKKESMIERPQVQTVTPVQNDSFKLFDDDSWVHKNKEAIKTILATLIFIGLIYFGILAERNDPRDCDGSEESGARGCVVYP